MASADKAMLAANARTRIVSVGDPKHREFGELCSVLGFTIEHQTTSKLDVSEADLRAVLIFLDDSNYTRVHPEILRLIDQNLFEYGSALIIVASNSTSALSARAQAIAALPKRRNPRTISPALSEFAAISLSDDPVLTDVQREEKLSDDLARFFRENPPQTSVDSGLNVIVDDGGKFWAQDEILLRRAFQGFTQVKLRKEEGGRSKDCTVWQVVAHKGPRVLEPFIAKAAVRDELTYEHDTYRDMVRDYIPFPFRAPLLEGCFVKGGSRAILVSAFVTRAQRFDDFIAQTANPELVVASIFHNALANWRKHAEEKASISIGARYVQAQEEAARASAAGNAIYISGPLLPDPQHLGTAYAACQKRRLRSKAPADLWIDLRGVPKSRHFMSGMHGDLNIRNIFVRWNSSDSILIDFSNSGDIDFLARDPAKLETSIALLCKGPKKRLLAETVLRKLYRPPLLPLRDLHVGDGRIEAIRQIRKQARGEGIDDPEYSLVVACHLLRFAQVAPGALVHHSLDGRRALSYSLACALIERYKN